MAVIQIGTETADFDTRAVVTYPAVTVPSDVAVMFGIASVPGSLIQEGSYVVIEAKYGAGEPGIRTPLLAKYFFVGGTMVFAVPTVTINASATQTVTIRLRPKEFYRGSGEIRQIPLSLIYEDTKTFPLSFGF